MDSPEVNTVTPEAQQDMTPVLFFRLIRCEVEQLNVNRDQKIPDIYGADTPAGLLLNSNRRSLALLPGVKFDDLTPALREASS